MKHKKAETRGQIIALPRIRGKPMDHSAEFHTKGFGPYPPKTGLRIVAAFDAGDLLKYLDRSGRVSCANEAFIQLLKGVGEEAQSGTQRGYALIEIGDKILESKYAPSPRWALCEAIIKNLFLIGDLDFKTAAAFLVRVDGLGGSGGDLFTPISELMLDPGGYLGNTEHFSNMVAYIRNLLRVGKGDGAKFAREWCEKLGLEEGDLESPIEIGVNEWEKRKPEGVDA